VLGAAIWRSVNAQLPGVEIMSGLGVAGFVVNVAAALVLRRFREGGDANARAIWLFSRNDALANIAVIVAAGLVALLRSPWPDLAIAAVIAVLFLHSASGIIGDARKELQRD
jgi:Co/Zn/Cd efflux system component